MSSFAAVAAQANATSTDRTSIPGPTSVYASWQEQVTNLPTPSTGCFVATYPLVQWVAGGSNCVAPRSSNLNVGNGNDNLAGLSSGNIWESQGYVSTDSGIASEADSTKGSNYYTLQENSNYFSTTYGGHYAVGWEQFAFQNNPGAGAGYVFIVYWLIGWYQAFGSCPSQQSGLSAWQQDASGLNCFAATNTSYKTPQENPSGSGLLNYQLKAYADNGGNDESVFCNGAACYAETAGYTILDLAGGWTSAEWNVLGYSKGTTACINGSGNPCSSPSGFPSITVEQYLYDSTGTSIPSSCGSGGHTSEKNDLTLGTCGTSPTSPYYIQFSMT